MEESNRLYPNKKYTKSDTEALEGASHNLSKGQLQAVYEAQKAGDDFEQIPANKDNDHMINKHEQWIYHVKITIPHFDSVTGEDQSQSRIDKFNPTMFEQCKKSGVWDGRIVQILHDPNKVVRMDENGKFAKKKIAKIV